MTSHILLGMAERTAVESSAAVALAGRTKLTATLSVAAVSGTLTVVIEASATGVEGSYATLATFAAINAPGVFTKIPGTDITVAAYHRYVRARITGITDATLELSLLAPWMDTTADAALFSKELRSFGDGFARIVGVAEDTVMDELLPRAKSAPVDYSLYPREAGRFKPEPVDTISQEYAEILAGLPVTLVLDANMTLAGFAAAIRAAIVAQSEHAFQRHKLSQRDDATALVSLRQFPKLAPGLMDGLSRFRPSTSITWRGR